MPSPGSIMMADELREDNTEIGQAGKWPPSSGEPRPPRGGGTSSVREHDTPLAVVSYGDLRERTQAYGPFQSQADAEYARAKLLSGGGDWIIVPLLRSP